MIFVGQHILLALIGVGSLIASFVTNRGRPYTTFFAFLFLAVSSLTASQVTNGEAIQGSTTLVQLYGLLAVVPFIKFVIEIWFNFFSESKEGARSPVDYTKEGIRNYERDNEKSTLEGVLNKNQSNRRRR